MPIDFTKRPKRFIVVPQATTEAARPQAATTQQLVRNSGLKMKAVRVKPAVVYCGRGGGGGGGTKPRYVLSQSGLKLVNTSPADGALLIEAKSADLVRQYASEGAKVFAERWYRLDHSARPWLKQSAALKAPRIRAGQSTVPFIVTVELADAARTRLPDALVTVWINAAKGIGIDGITDRFGRVRFALSTQLKRVDGIQVDPLHGGWPVALPAMALGGPGPVVDVPPIDLTAPDVRGLVYGKPAAASGKRVKVAVIDTGVGPHSALKVTGGRNTTTESARRLRDEYGHGSHVAGVIASTATGYRRGEASAVDLYAYRIFEAGDPYASSFAIEAAITQAAEDGCDLINLSIGGGDADPAIQGAIDFAWQRGCVCLAAAGNDGVAVLDYPARYRRALAVSAIGLNGSWPNGANFGSTISAVGGKVLAGLRTFFASFSNYASKVAVTAPGVAVVSTIFGNRWGVMSGTSMATPIATGVLARRLAASPDYDLPRNAKRAQAIVALAKANRENLNMPANRQGNGLAR